MSLTRAFADLLAAWPADDPALLAQCRLLLLDGLAVAAAGASEPGPMRMAELTRRNGSTGPAQVIGHGFSTSVAQAARINGMAMHVLDFEPMCVMSFPAMRANKASRPARRHQRRVALLHRPILLQKPSH